MSDHQLTVVGPVNAGKTTYLAALYFLLKNSGDNYNLRVDPLHIAEDRTYLIEISQYWARLEEIPHTVTGTWKTLELPLRQKNTEQKLMVYLPDMAGEMFGETLKAREWPSHYANQVRTSDRLLLFINYLDYRETVFIDEEWAGHLEADPSIKLRHWEANEAILPSDVFYTDLLQQIVYDDIGRKYRLSVIISAWDAILLALSNHDKALYYNPDAYFSERFPLLKQFLESHEQMLQTKIFGVSAYGGNQSDESVRAALEDLDPHERVKVVTNGVVSHNITLPLQHLLDDD